MHPDRRRAGRAIRKNRRAERAEIDAIVFAWAPVIEGWRRAFKQFAIAMQAAAEAITELALAVQKEDHERWEPKTRREPKALSLLEMTPSSPSPSSGNDSPYLSALWREDSPASSVTATPGDMPSDTAMSPISFPVDPSEMRVRGVST